MNKNIENLQDNNIRSIISEILNIPNDDSWLIYDSIPEEDLYLIHHKGKYDTKHNNLRGIIVDTKNKRILCKSSKYTHNVVLSKLPDKNDIKLVDTEGEEISLKLKEVSIRCGFEGSIIRIFSHNGKVYFSTHKKIDARKVKWGNSDEFYNIYKSLGGLDEELFQEDDSYCYTFIICHRDLLSVSKINIGCGFLVLLSKDKIKETDKEPYQFNTVRELPNIIEKPFILEPRNLTINEANEHLQHGFNIPNLNNIDQRLLQGEFLILYLDNVNIKISSVSYNWRNTIRGNETNLLRRFYILENDAIFLSPKDYSYKYLKMPTYTYKMLEDAIKKDGYIIHWKHNVMKRNQDAKFNIWLCFLAAVPLHEQKNVLTFLSKMKKDRYDVAKWLFSIHCEYPDISVLNLSKRACNIINQAREYSRINAGTLKNLFIQNSINYFLSREEGNSLIKLTKEMQEYSK